MTQWYGIGPGRDMHPAVSQQTPAGKIERSRHENFIPRPLSQTPTGRLAEIVVSWHWGWEEVGTERGYGRKDFLIDKIKDGPYRT